MLVLSFSPNARAQILPLLVFQVQICRPMRGLKKWALLLPAFVENCPTPALSNYNFSICFVLLYLLFEYDQLYVCSRLLV